MKAIVIIDMPDDLDLDEVEADVMVGPVYGWEVIARYNQLIKPMPRKLDANDWHRMFSGLFSEREAKGYGWNACLEEIEGGRNE